MPGGDSARHHQSELGSLRRLVTTLTPRERQVFDLIVRGKINKQVAFELGTVERTVKAHRHQIMEKMQVNSFAGLVSIAERLGMLAPTRASRTSSLFSTTSWTPPHPARKHQTKAM